VFGEPVTVVAAGGAPVSFVPVPSLRPVYKETLTTTTDETTTTWADIAIGTAHPSRIVILACMVGADIAMTGTINGVAQIDAATNASRQVGILVFAVPTGTTCTIAVTGTVNSARKAVSVYVAYPRHPMIVGKDADGATGATTTDAVCTAITTEKGGSLIYVGAQAATLGAFTTTWSGVDAVTEDVDAQIEATSSYTTGMIATFTEAISGNLTLSETVSGTKRLFAASFAASDPGF
jgi:hypothetical protein